MAATEIKDALKSSADAIAKYVKDAASLNVKTQLVEIGAGAAPHLAAETTLRLDGDSTTILPGQRGESGRLEVDPTVHDLHMQAVNAAIEYRARMLDAMLTVLRSRLP